MVVRTRLLLGNPVSKKLVHMWGVNRAKYINRLIGDYLKKDYRILDLGAGDCIINDIYSKKGYDMTPVDIENLSLVDGLEPMLYDGKRLPFKDNSFDLTMIVTMLHHTPKPEVIIKEAIRVSKRLVIIEDIFDGRLEFHVTCFIDSLQNQQFNGHPHTNKTDEEWKKVFKGLGLNLVDTKYTRWSLLLRHGTYYLEKP